MEAEDAVKGVTGVTALTEKIEVKVENGWVTLAGQLHWNYQRDAAKGAVRYLSGVKGLWSMLPHE